MGFTLGGRQQSGGSGSAGGIGAISGGDADGNGVDDLVQLLGSLQEISKQVQSNTQAIKDLALQIKESNSGTTLINENLAKLSKILDGLETKISSLEEKIGALSTTKSLGTAPNSKVYAYTQATPVDKLVIDHKEGKNPISVLVTDLGGSKKEINWKFSDDKNSITFYPASPTTFQITLTFDL